MVVEPTLTTQLVCGEVLGDNIIHFLVWIAFLRSYSDVSAIYGPETRRALEEPRACSPMRRECFSGPLPRLTFTSSAGPPRVFVRYYDIFGFCGLLERELPEHYHRSTSLQTFRR